jgi:uncharacterized membrane protein
MSPPSPIVARYLDQLAQGLAECGLPDEDRAEIAREIESHLADAVAAGTSIAEGIHRLGSPHELARAYAVELLLRPAPPPRRQVWRRAPAVLVAWLTPLLSYAIAGVLLAVGGALAIVGLLGALGGLFGPWLPLDPTLRPGLPQLVVVLASLAVGGLGALLLRLVRIAWRIARARPRSLDASPKENRS